MGMNLDLDVNVDSGMDVNSPRLDSVYAKRTIMDIDVISYVKNHVRIYRFLIV